MKNLRVSSLRVNDDDMNIRTYIMTAFAAVAGVVCAAFLPGGVFKVAAVIVAVSMIVLLAYSCVSSRNEVEEIKSNQAGIEAKMRNYGIFRDAAAKCVKLEERLAALNAVPVVDQEQSLGLQLSRLNNSLASVIPDFKEKGYETLMDDLAGAVRSEELVYAFRDKIVKPFMEKLRHCEIPVSQEDEERLLALTIEVAMSSVDVVDTCRENINARAEQRLTKDILLGQKTREEAYELARKITDNPMETPAWARAIKNIAMHRGIADKRILYSGYKIV